MSTPLTVDRRQLAALLGVSPSHVTRLVAAGMPVLTTGGGRGRASRFDAVAALAWMREQAAAPPGTSSVRDEYLAALRDRVRQDIAVRDGSLVERRLVVEAGQTYTRRWSRQLQYLPRQLFRVGAIANEQIAPIAAQIRELLEDIASWHVPDDDTAEDNSATR